MNKNNIRTEQLVGVTSVVLAGVVQASASQGQFTIWNTIIGIPLLFMLAAFTGRRNLRTIEKIALASIWGFTAMSGTGYIAQVVYQSFLRLDPITPYRLGAQSTPAGGEVPGQYYLSIMIVFSLCAYYWLSTRPREYSQERAHQKDTSEGTVPNGSVAQSIQEHDTIKKIAEHLWIVEGRPAGCDEAIWLRAQRIYLDECKYTPSPLLVLLFLCLLLLGPYCWLSLKGPIQVDYEISWIILALISSITLSYVGLLNTLRDRYTQSAFVKNRPKLRQIMMLMSWALFLMFICILFLLIRIVLNTYVDFTTQAASGSILAFVTRLDYMILWSFFWSSLLRIAIFFVSYWKVLFV
ncbi:MAG: DUF2934 domain-containing protein [Synechococcaceae cyanobacterium]|jgi:hypothetical protein